MNKVYFILFGLILCSVFSTAASEPSRLGTDSVAIYCSMREVFLTKDADDLTNMDVLEYNFYVQDYLLHALERNAYLTKLYTKNKSEKAILGDFKSFLEKQAREYNKKLECMLFRPASSLELKQGREDYRCMKRLIMKIDKFDADLLNVPIDILFRTLPKA